MHKYPVPHPGSSEQKCGGPDVGGHYNPYNVIIGNSPKAGTGSTDEYEIGMHAFNVS